MLAEQARGPRGLIGRLSGPSIHALLGPDLGEFDWSQVLGPLNLLLLH